MRYDVTSPEAVAAAARHRGPVLLVGEPGVGKRHVARLVHERRHGDYRPFATLAADSLAEEVLEAILYREPPALPTGLREIQRDCLAGARGGTLYVADLSSVRPRLARRIVHSAEPGASEWLGVGVIFGATADVPPVAEQPSPAFVLSIPALRDRPDEVQHLAEHFAARAAHRLGKEPPALSPRALSALLSYSWPGNVAELERVIDHAVRRLGPPVLDASLVPHTVVAAREPSTTDAWTEGLDLHDEVQRYERSLIVAAIERCGGVQTKAAEMLGIKPTTLHAKLAHHEIDAHSFKSRRP